MLLKKSMLKYLIYCQELMTQDIKLHETCKCKCRLDASVCNKKQLWNKEKCRCDCEELIGKGICDKRFIWNRSNCEFECDKLCDIGEYLDYQNYKCRKKLIDNIVEECSENIDGNEMIYSGTLNDYEKLCSSCKIYIALNYTILVQSTWYYLSYF